MPINPATGQSYRTTDNGKVRQHIYLDHTVRLASKIAAQRKNPDMDVAWNGRKWTPKMPVRRVPADSAYMSNMASDAAQREQQLAGLQQQREYDQTDTAEALRRLGQQRAQASQTYNANSSRQGSLLSGRAMQGYGRMDTGYQQRGNDMQDQLARRMAQRTQAASDINQNASLYEDVQRAQAAQRASDNYWNNRLALYLGRKK